MAVADNPVVENRDVFYRVFVSSCVGIRISTELASVSSGECVITGRSGLRIPTATLPNGTPMLVVLADVKELADREAGSRFAELSANDVIKMAMTQNAGIIVQSSLPGYEAWAGIPNGDLQRLMRTSEKSKGSEE